MLNGEGSAVLFMFKYIDDTPIKALVRDNMEEMVINLEALPQGKDKCRVVKREMLALVW